MHIAEWVAAVAQGFGKFQGVQGTGQNMPKMVLIFVLVFVLVVVLTITVSVLNPKHTLRCCHSSVFSSLCSVCFDVVAFFVL